MAQIDGIRTGLLTVWRSWPERERVALRVRTVSESTDYEIGTADLPAAKRRVLTTKEIAASNGRYTGSDMVWHIPIEMMPTGVTPKPFDQIIDSDQRVWTVLESTTQVLRTRHKLTCRDMVLAYDLYQRGTFQRATYAASAGGGRVATWAAIATATNVPCRVQPVSAELRDMLGKRGERSQYTIFLDAWPTGLTLEDRFTIDGTVYQLLAWRNRDRLDQLPELDAEIVPE